MSPVTFSISLLTILSHQHLLIQFHLQRHRAVCAGWVLSGSAWRVVCGATAPETCDDPFMQGHTCLPRPSHACTCICMFPCTKPAGLGLGAAIFIPQRWPLPSLAAAGVPHLLLTRRLGLALVSAEIFRGTLWLSGSCCYTCCCCRCRGWH